MSLASERINKPSAGRVLTGLGRALQQPAVVMGVLLGALLSWSYAPVLAPVVQKWATSPQYTHGFLVPGFALVLLWLRRAQLADAGNWRPSWWGLALLLCGSLVRLCGTLYYAEFLDAISLLPCLAGIVLCTGGKRALIWSLPALAYLLFMFPLPYRLEVAMGYSLRRFAVVASGYCLQTLGFPAVVEGNVILLEEARIGVVEACSGLSMLVTFFALSTALALVVRRPLLDRIVLVLSALPIGIFANLVRIVVTAVLAELAGPRLAHLVFHELAGWLMMPLALVMLALTLAVLSRLFSEPLTNEPALFGMGEIPAQALPVAAGRRMHQTLAEARG